MISNDNVTLCFPGTDKTCFACCPPIRSKGYEHIQYKSMVRRMLLENTIGFDGSAYDVKPITGFSCWALGYLDEEYKRVGCLLHPAVNGGKDLRFRVDFGEKCNRETCPEAKTFLRLRIRERKFWLGLTDGLDSFSYSSRKFNPLFSMMGWGAKVLEKIARAENNRAMKSGIFFQKYAFFSTTLDPRANAYILRQVVNNGKTALLCSKKFRVRLEAFCGSLMARFNKEEFSAPKAPYTHLLGIDSKYLDFLRLSAGIVRIKPEDAIRLKEMVDTAIDEFRTANQTVR